MSADNGIYILPSPKRSNIKEIEYRVAHCQAIDNINDIIYGTLYETLLFSDSVIYDNLSDANFSAKCLFGEIELALGEIEYGICNLEIRDHHFPKMPKEAALFTLYR